MKTAMNKQQQLRKSREAVNREVFGTDAWELAMQVVRQLVDEINAESTEEFCSIDSGVHRTRLFDGRVI
jgi:hypothetical protein